MGKINKKFKKHLEEYIQKEFYDNSLFFDKWCDEGNAHIVTDYERLEGRAVADLSYIANEDDFPDWVDDYIRTNEYEIEYENINQNFYLDKDEAELLGRAFKLTTEDNDLDMVVMESDVFAEYIYKRILKLINKE